MNDEILVRFAVRDATVPSSGIVITEGGGVYLEVDGSEEDSLRIASIPALQQVLEQVQATRRDILRRRAQQPGQEPVVVTEEEVAAAVKGWRDADASEGDRPMMTAALSAAGLLADIGQKPYGLPTVVQIAMMAFMDGPRLSLEYSMRRALMAVKRAQAGL